ERRERRPVAAEGQLRLVAEAEERLLAAERAPARGPRLDVGRQHGPGVGIVGVFAECAVGAAVAAEVGDRQEDLRRIRDRAAPVCVAPPAGHVEQQLGGRRVVEQRDRFGAWGRGSGRRARERGDESGTYGRGAASPGAPHWWADFGSYRRGPDLSSC